MLLRKPYLFKLIAISLHAMSHIPSLKILKTTCMLTELSSSGANFHITHFSCIASVRPNQYRCYALLYNGSPCNANISMGDCASDATSSAIFEKRCHSITPCSSMLLVIRYGQIEHRPLHLDCVWICITLGKLRHLPDVKKLEYVRKKYEYRGKGQLEYGLIFVITCPEPYRQTPMDVIHLVDIIIA